MKRPLPKVPLGQRVVLNEANKQLQKYNSETGLNRIDTADRSVAIHKSSADLTLPRKPTRAPSLRQQSPPSTVVIRANNGKGFRELAPNNNNNLDDSSEYCDVDYEAMDDREKTDTRIPTTVDYFADMQTLKRSCNQLRQSNTSLTSLPSARPPPPLPTRTNQSAPFRDSACVADFAIYDRPKAVCKLAYTAVKRMIDVSNYHCASLPHDNKPLTAETTAVLRNALFEQPPANCALMMTHEDCRLLRLLEPEDLQGGANNGLVVLLLPHGSPVRADLLERVGCTQFAVVVSILSCGDLILALKALDKWIAIAKELLIEFGNIFSFVNIMSGLCSKELDQISTLWTKLEKMHPKSFSDFQVLLVPALERLRRSGAMPSNATPCLLPYIQPMLILMESSNSPYTNAFDWKFDDNDYDGPMDTLWQWLEMGREWSLVSTEIRAVAKRKYGDPPAEATNPFRTEFLMRCLFGANCSIKEFPKRYETMGRLVKVLAERFVLIGM